MARSEARIKTSIWTDRDFVRMRGDQQRVFMLIVSQEGLSFVGAIAYTPRRWAQLATETTVRQVEKAVGELAKARFVVVDYDTQELWVRSLLRHDGIIGNPRLVKVVARDFAAIQSDIVRSAIVAEYRDEIAAGDLDLPDPHRDPHRDPRRDPRRHPHGDRGANTHTDPSHADAPGPLPQATTTDPKPPSESPASSSSSDSRPAETSSDDDDASLNPGTPNDDTQAQARLLEATWARLAVVDLDRLGRERPDRVPPEGPRRKGWLATAAVNRKATHARNARQLLAEHPDLDPAKLAELLTGSVLARRERPPCDHCDGGWVELASGDVVACTVCERVGAGARS